jgi:hypothetical protein
MGAQTDGNIDGPSIGLDPLYAWLGRLGTLPKIVLTALGCYGVKETPGPGDTPAILSWAKALERAGKIAPGEYAHDAVPWCGLGIGYWALSAGKPVVEKPLWALNWAKYGEVVAANHGSLVRPALIFFNSRAASLGDILVFARRLATPGKTDSFAGHVGLYIAEDLTHYHVLGANQGDAVSIVRIAKARCVAIRRPPFATMMPKSAVPHYVEAAGTLSASEA